MPEAARGGAIEGAADLRELGFRGRDIAGAKGLQKGLDTIADDGASRAVAFTNNDVLSESFFCALNIWHGNLEKNLRNNVFLQTSPGA